jgi:hypothetical protein
VLQLGLPDEFIEHGDPAKLLALQGWMRQASRPPSASVWLRADAMGPGLRKSDGLTPGPSMKGLFFACRQEN